MKYIILIILLSCNVLNAEWRSFKEVRKDFRSDDAEKRAIADGEFGLWPWDTENQYLKDTGIYNIYAISRYRLLPDESDIKHCVIVSYRKEITYIEYHIFDKHIRYIDILDDKLNVLITIKVDRINIRGHYTDEYQYRLDDEYVRKFKYAVFREHKGD